MCEVINPNQCHTPQARIVYKREHRRPTPPTQTPDPAGWQPARGDLKKTSVETSDTCPSGPPDREGGNRINNYNHQERRNKVALLRLVQVQGVATGGHELTCLISWRPNRDLIEAAIGEQSVNPAVKKGSAEPKQGGHRCLERPAGKILGEAGVSD
ncbi:hypothetical protein H920_12806 [Fukomys damarensis]|uniref:Uncharacterized protein n=1 Tax=Fukomys damarensis TaxID=885580 RepID=A0A091D449_FUKDA|nr:hypothetical protein H920_12806 [Fukomys damarensis]